MQSVLLKMVLYLNLKCQRRMASEILKVGYNRIWIDPTRIDDVELCISNVELEFFI
jgi:large subunit ribosomal protein L19e